MYLYDLHTVSPSPLAIAIHPYKIQSLCLWLHTTSLPVVTITNRIIQVGAHEMITLNGVDIALYSDNLDDFTDNIAVFRNKGN